MDRAAPEHCGCSLDSSVLQKLGLEHDYNGFA